MRVWVSSSCRMMLGLSGLMVPSLVFFAGLVLSAGCSGGGVGSFLAVSCVGSLFTTTSGAGKQERA